MRAARAKVLLFAGLLLAAEAAGLAAQYNGELTAFIVVALLQGAIWAAAAAVITRSPDRRHGLALILAIAILLRVVALAAPVYLSSDIYRYIWDGRIQAAGINPYRYVPIDPQLVLLRDNTIYPNINRREYAPTIYPPIAQMIFLLATRLGENVLSMKAVFVIIEAIGVWALLRILHAVQAPLENIVLYAWHPLPIWEIAGSGHIDAAVVAFVALALAAAITGRRGWSGAALGAAALVKFFPLVLAPALWRLPDWRLPVAFIAVIVAAYLPYLGAGSRVLGFLPQYAAEENFTSGTGFWLLDIVWRAIPVPFMGYLGLVAIIMSGLAICALRRPTGPLPTLRCATALGSAALIFASPHYPWYFVLLVALLSVGPWWPAWWLTLMAPLLYWDPETGRIPVWVEYAIYGGFLILCGIDVAWRTLFAARTLSAARTGATDASKRAT